MPAHHRHRGFLQASAEALHACCPTAQVGVLCAVGFASALFAGCGELEPMREPEVADLELTTDTLKASVRDAQRMVAELRADLEARRKELAEAQIARAQLEGLVREAERRVTEARHVIELQREELATARAKQAHAFQNSFQLQDRMKQLQKQLSRTRKSDSAQDRQKAAPLSSGGAIQKGQDTVQISAQRTHSPEFPESPQMMATPAVLIPVQADSTSSEVESQRNAQTHVLVKSGDTLWNIAHKYHVNVEDLRTFNQLTDNTIVIGRTLRLPDDRPMRGAGADKGTSTP